MPRSPFGRIAGAILAVATGFATIPAASAQQQPPQQQPQQLPSPAIVVVDIAQVLRESKAGKGVQAQLERQKNLYSTEVAKQEEELKKVRDELERQRTLLAPEAFAQRSKEFKDRYDDLNASFQNKSQTLQHSYNQAVGKVNDAALQVIAELAVERHANLVVAKQAIVFEADGFDITPEVITRLDQRLPSVEVSFSEAAGEPAKAKAGTTTGKKN